MALQKKGRKARRRADAAGDGRAQPRRKEAALLSPRPESDAAPADAVKPQAAPVTVETQTPTTEAATGTMNPRASEPTASAEAEAHSLQESPAPSPAADIGESHPAPNQEDAAEAPKGSAEAEAPVSADSEASPAPVSAAAPEKPQAPESEAEAASAPAPEADSAPNFVLAESSALPETAAERRVRRLKARASAGKAPNSSEKSSARTAEDAEKASAKTAAAEQAKSQPKPQSEAKPDSEPQTQTQAKPTFRERFARRPSSEPTPKTAEDGGRTDAPKAKADAEPKTGITTEAESAPAKPSESPKRLLEGLGRTFALWSVLLLSGALLSFAAANWTAWEADVRLCAFGGAALLAFLPAVLLKRASNLTRDLSASAGGLLTLLLFVVIGQTWQTGDSAASLFLGVGILMTPWVLAVRRPIVFTLWHASIFSGLLLDGFERFERLYGTTPFACTLPAAAFAALSVLVLGLLMRLRPRPGLRPAAFVPSFVFAVLLGLAPPVLFAIQNEGLPSFAGLPILHFVCAVLGIIGLILARRPECRSFAVLAAAGWVNAFLILIVHPAVMHITTLSLLYALVLANGFICLVWTFFAHRASLRRKSEVPSTDGDSKAVGLAAVWSQAAAAMPGIASGALGAAAVMLGAATVELLIGGDYKALALGSYVVGILIGIWALLQKCRQAVGQSSGLSAGLVALQAMGLLLAASGWVLLLSIFDGPAWAWAILSAAALGAVVFPKSPVVFAVLLAPYAVQSLALQAHWADALFALTTLAGFCALSRGRIGSLAARLLPVLLAAVWAAGLYRGGDLINLLTESRFVDALASGVWAQIGSWLPLGAVLGAALLLAAAVSANRAGGTLFNSVRCTDALVLAAAGLLCFPNHSSLLVLSASILAVLSASSCSVFAPGVIALLGLLYAAAELFWAHHAFFAPFGNPLLEAAVVYGAAGVLLGVAALRLLMRRRSAKHRANRQPKGFTLSQGLALGALLITAAGAAYTVSNRLEILAAGDVRIVKLLPQDPRDMLLGDFMTLRYTFKDEARRASSKAIKASGASSGLSKGFVTGFCLTAAKPQGEAPSDWTVTGVKVRRDGVVSACPKDTQWEIAALGGVPKLPNRWFFPSGESARFDAAAAAELRCLKEQCVLAQLLNAQGSPIARHPQD